VLTLALDTTTRAGSVAVVNGDDVLAVVKGDAARTHGERLPAELDEALRRAGIVIRDVQLLAVASGPGAFTGLRIGLAAIQGLAMVTGLPVIAVSALDAHAFAVDAGGTAARAAPVAVWMDAQRGEVFAAYYPESSVARALAGPVTVPIVARPDLVLAAVPHEPPPIFTGDGTVKYKEQILQALGDSVQLREPTPALAPFIATIGMARARNGLSGPPHALQPLYVRRPDAELAKGKS
jgi:tRNA threonylcarbamoyladenosine biosynthesis protein TsaB